MRFCWELETRCPGCPVEGKLPLPPEDEIAVVKAVAGAISNLNEAMTIEDAVREISISQDNTELAAWHTVRLATNIAVHQIVGACDQYEGPVLYDPEFEEKKKQFIESIK